MRARHPDSLADAKNPERIRPIMRPWPAQVADSVRSGSSGGCPPSVRTQWRIPAATNRIHPTPKSEEPDSSGATATTRSVHSPNLTT